MCLFYSRLPLILAALLALSVPGWGQTFDSGVKASDVASVEILDDYVTGRNQNGKPIITLPYKVLHKAEVLQVGNRAILLQTFGGQWTGIVRITSLPLAFDPVDPRWKANDIATPFDFLEQLRQTFRGDLQGRKAEANFSVPRYQAFFGPGSLGKKLAEMRADINERDKKVEADIEAEAAPGITAFANDLLSSINYSLYDDLGFSTRKVPAQIYQLHLRLKNQAPIPQGALRTELMFLNRWLLEQWWNKSPSGLFCGESFEINFPGYAFGNRGGLMWKDPLFNLREAQVKRQDWGPGYDPTDSIWKLRKVNEAEKLTYGVNDLGIALERAGVVVTVFDENLVDMVAAKNK